RAEWIHQLEGCAEPQAVGHPAADVREVDRPAEGVTREALAVVLRTVEGEGEPDVLGHSLHEFPTRRFGRGDLGRGNGPREVLRRVHGEGKHGPELLGEALGPDVEVAGNDRPLLTEQTEDRVLVAYRQEDEKLPGVE